MAKQTDTARIVNYINRKIPKRMKFKDFKEQIISKISEIITNNLSQGKDPISFYSVRLILEYYKELAFEKLKDKYPENTLKKYLDNEFREIERDIFDKFYRR